MSVHAVFREVMGRNLSKNAKGFSHKDIQYATALTYLIEKEFDMGLAYVCLTNYGLYSQDVVDEIDFERESGICSTPLKFEDEFYEYVKVIKKACKNQGDFGEVLIATAKYSMYQDALATDNTEDEFCDVWGKNTIKLDYRIGKTVLEKMEKLKNKKFGSSQPHPE